jgi:hypothetical protein
LSGESENPYADHLPVAPSLQPFVPAANQLGTVRQVKVVALLQIALGLLELLMGGFLVAMGFFMNTTAMAEAMKTSDKDMLVWMQGFYWIFGGLVAVIACMRLLAGGLNLWYRGYYLSIISLFAGLVSTFTCYCGPLTVGMCIYGLVILFNPAVAYAFELARQGKSPRDILAHFEASSHHQAG